MHFAHVIQRKGRVLAVLLTLAIMGMLIAAVVFFLPGRSPKPFEMDDLYSLFD
jgi:hypothetical protein